MGAALHKALADRNAPQVLRMYALHLISRIFFYWGPNAVLYLMEKHGWGKRWKIQGSRSARPELKWEAVTHNLKGDVGQFFISWAMSKLLMLGKQKALKDNAEEVPEAAQVAQDNGKQDGSTALRRESGWSHLRFSGPSPKLLTHFWQVAVAYFGYDAMFYWSHRLMHHKRLYKHCHKIHHQFHTPIGISSSYEHALEGAVQILNWYLPIGFAGYLNRGHGGLHISTLFYYHCFRWIETVDAHSGYELPFSPFHFLPFFGGARMHDYHHRAFDGAYGASFFWDRLCGTDSDFFREIIEEGGFLRGGKRVLP
jgi:sterol desaturase/sphingolipid hydroxylase (fatty acid hydroxylase superfamily)